jgi:hypothetical protein
MNPECEYQIRVNDFPLITRTGEEIEAGVYTCETMNRVLRTAFQTHMKHSTTVAMVRDCIAGHQVHIRRRTIH